MDTDVEELCCGLQQCMLQQLWRIHHITVSKYYYNTYTQKAHNIHTGYIIQCVHSFYGLHLALHSLVLSTRYFVLGSLHSRIVPSLMSSFDRLCGLPLFRLSSKIALMGRVLRLMCPNHFSFRLWTSSIIGVSPVISLSRLMGYNWREHS